MFGVPDFIKAAAANRAMLVFYTHVFTHLPFTFYLVAATTHGLLVTNMMYRIFVR